jgi:hypothetical protein
MVPALQAAQGHARSFLSFQSSVLSFQSIVYTLQFSDFSLRSSALDSWFSAFVSGMGNAGGPLQSFAVLPAMQYILEE